MTAERLADIRTQFAEVGVLDDVQVRDLFAEIERLHVERRGLLHARMEAIRLRVELADALEALGDHECPDEDEPADDDFDGVGA